MRRLIVSIAMLLAVAGSREALAQHGAGGVSQTGSGASQPLNPSTPNMPIYNVMRGGEIQIDVNLWGFVGSPGHYRVPSSTSLVELLSFAGGPTAQARLVDIRIVHADTAAQKRVEMYNLESYRDNGDLSQNPLLEPGDTIIVSGRALDVFFQAIGIITNVMVIITALINFISFTTK
ncbi:MAG: polysaccharide biosynthesis/export family protein [Candidatus Kapaibacterium sp.]